MAGPGEGRGRGGGRVAQGQDRDAPLDSGAATRAETAPACGRRIGIALDMELGIRWLLGALLLLLALAADCARDGGRRGAARTGTCRYVRGAWSECDPNTNVRSRTLTLKKGDPASCERDKTLQKKCKKACRYEKSTWSECGAGGEMTRTDPLKASSDPACEPSRRLTKKCNKKPTKAPKDKGRRNRQ